MYRCPICKNENVQKVYEGALGNLMFCNVCRTTDSTAQFLSEPEEETQEKVEINTFDPALIFPPDDIIEAVEKVHQYFTVERRAKQWAFGPVQSRDEPALIGIEHVRNMALAFGYDLVVHYPVTRELRQ